MKRDKKKRYRETRRICKNSWFLIMATKVKKRLKRKARIVKKTRTIREKRLLNLSDYYTVK
jgi:hypothetical protein